MQILVVFFCIPIQKSSARLFLRQHLDNNLKRQYIQYIFFVADTKHLFIRQHIETPWHIRCIKFITQKTQLILDNKRKPKETGMDYQIL